MAGRAYRLGVDFGTSHTVAMLAGLDGRIRPLLFDASPLLPSAVFAGPDATLLAGADALRAAVGDPGAFEPNPKRRVDDGALWLGQRTFPVPMLVGAVLHRVYVEALRATGGMPLEVVLTHPASWGAARLRVLAEAARLAGVHQVGFVAEPVGAAAYLAVVRGWRMPPGRRVVVYDLGAGTFDVTVLGPTGTGMAVLGTAGLDNLGGLDFDDLVVRHARTSTGATHPGWQRLDRPDGPADWQHRRLLWDSARGLKEHLSRHPAGDLYVPILDRPVRLTRDEFESAARPLLDRTATTALRLLADLGVPTSEVGAVFLVGGASRIPLAGTTLHRILGIPPTVIDYPELVVAEGALYCPPTRLPAADPHGDPSGGPPTVGAGPWHPSRAGPTQATRHGTELPAVTAIPIDAPAPAVIAIPVHVGTPAAALGPTGGSAAIGTTATAAPTALASASGTATWPWQALRRTGSRVVALALAVGLAVLLGADSHRPSPAPPGPDPSTAGPVRGVEPVPELLTGSRPAFHPDGTLLATVGEDRTVQLWDVATRQPVGEPLSGHTDEIYDVTFSPDGTVLATAGRDDTVRLWDVASRRQLGAPITGLADPSYHRCVTCGGGAHHVTFSPDGTRLATVGAGGRIRWWNARTREPVAVTFTGETSDEVVFSPDGTIVAAVDVTTVQLWHGTTYQPLGAPLAGHRGLVNGLAFSADSSLLATTDLDDTILLWDVPGRRILDRLSSTDLGIRDVAFLDVRTTLLRHGPNLVQFWDIGRRAPTGVTIARDTPAAFTELAVSPVGDLVAIARDDDRVQLWSLTR
ncbi:Hsp70 family protein [Plantactinospora soyae]|uniref:Hsp70 family protein n=1 Tax=Plantactinospora soyae TaxID=1544732 RepID=A0A927MBT4_9ACTN|nr:Hsp70 family protein [Plantactinospora soyae]MBE1490715.1 hypothetical protein [Plantactinospora soyae]